MTNCLRISWSNRCLLLVLLLVLVSELFSLRVGTRPMYRTRRARGSATEEGSRDVFVGNLETFVDKETIQEAMINKLLGSRRFDLLPYNATHSKGYGFLRFANTSVASKAAEMLRDLSINNRSVRVSLNHEETDKREVLITNLDSSISERMLKKICDDTVAVGKVKSIEMPTVPSSGLSWGYARVLFVDTASALLAITRLNGISLLNKALSVSYAPFRDASAAITTTATAAAPSVDDDKYVVFLHSLSRQCTQDWFQKEMNRILGEGSFRSADLCYDPVTRRSRCYAFVKFSSEADMKRALQLLNAATILGKALNADQKKAKEQSTVTATAVAAASQGAYGSVVEGDRERGPDRERLLMALGDVFDRQVLHSSEDQEEERDDDDDSDDMMMSYEPSVIDYDQLEEAAFSSDSFNDDDDEDDDDDVAASYAADVLSMVEEQQSDDRPKTKRGAAGGGRKKSVSTTEEVEEGDY